MRFEPPAYVSGLIEFRITERDMAAFRRFAGRVGWSRGKSGEPSIVYGGLIVAQVSRLLSARMPGRRCVWRSLALTFLGPLHVDEFASLTAEVIHVNEERGMMDFKLHLDAGTQRIAEGGAVALSMHPPPRLSRAAA